MDWIRLTKNVNWTEIQFKEKRNEPLKISEQSSSLRSCKLKTVHILSRSLQTKDCFTNILLLKKFCDSLLFDIH